MLGERVDAQQRSVPSGPAPVESQLVAMKVSPLQDQPQRSRWDRSHDDLARFDRYDDRFARTSHGLGRSTVRRGPGLSRVMGVIGTVDGSSRAARSTHVAGLREMLQRTRPKRALNHPVLQALELIDEERRRTI
jgi:hypothetical protein